MNKQLKKLKPFNLETAKAGGEVVNRLGEKVRLLCYDAAGEYPIIGLTYSYNEETPDSFTCSGRFLGEDNTDERDLFMKPIKQEGWINIYSNGCGATTKNSIYCSYNGAFANRSQNCVDTIKIEWED